MTNNEPLPRTKICAACHQTYARPPNTNNRKWATRRYCTNHCARVGIMRRRWDEGRKKIGWWDDSQWLVIDEERGL